MTRPLPHGFKSQVGAARQGDRMIAAALLILWCVTAQAAPRADAAADPPGEDAGVASQPAVVDGARDDECDEQAAADWLADLGAPDWSVRQEAARRLAGCDEGIMPRLAAAYRITEDHEARLAIRRIARELFTRARLAREGAFLGISQQMVFDPRIPEGQSGVQVMRVLPDTPAAAAGLIAGDVIVAVDEQLTSRLQGNDDFVRLISARQPGDEITLRVLRGIDTHELRVRLGCRPVEYADPQTRKDILDDFRLLWEERFEGADAPTGTGPKSNAASATRP